MSSKDHVCKVIFIGDQAVGKTSLISTYVASQFKAQYNPTKGVNVVAKEFSLEGKIVTVVIWDIAGQEAFNKVRGKYYADTAVASIVYDVTSHKTLEDVRVWLNDLKRYLKEDVPLILVGNKIDLPRRVVSIEEGKGLTKEIGASFIETSAKTGENVRKLFEKILDLYVLKHDI